MSFRLKSVPSILTKAILASHDPAVLDMCTVRFRIADTNNVLRYSASDMLLKFGAPAVAAVDEYDPATVFVLKTVPESRHAYYVIPIGRTTPLFVTGGVWDRYNDIKAADANKWEQSNCSMRFVWQVEPYVESNGDNTLATRVYVIMDNKNKNDKRYWWVSEEGATESYKTAIPNVARRKQVFGYTAYGTRFLVDIASCGPKAMALLNSVDETKNVPNTSQDVVMMVNTVNPGKGDNGIGSWSWWGYLLIVLGVLIAIIIIVVVLRQLMKV
jgi:hypothetical protein